MMSTYWLMGRHSDSLVSVITDEGMTGNGETTFHQSHLSQGQSEPWIPLPGQVTPKKGYHSRKEKSMAGVTMKSAKYEYLTTESSILQKKGEIAQCQVKPEYQGDDIPTVHQETGDTGDDMFSGPDAVHSPCLQDKSGYILAKRDELPADQHEAASTDVVEVSRKAFTSVEENEICQQFTQNLEVQKQKVDEHSCDRQPLHQDDAEPKNSDKDAVITADDNSIN